MAAARPLTAVVRRPYSGLSADERDAQRIQRLSDSALELFGTRGFVDTTVEQICTQAKVSTRHFYQLFANKSAVFVQLYEHLTADCLTRALTSWDGSQDRPYADRLSEALSAYLQPLIHDPRATRIVFVEVLGINPLLDRSSHNAFERVVAIIESEGAVAVRGGEITDRDFRFAALALSGATSSILCHWMSDPDWMPVASLEQKLGELAVRLLLL